MSAMTDELVHYGVSGPLATITLDSPHNKNALSRQLVTELFAHLESAEADPDVRVVLVRSADRVFCSGADLSEATTVGMEEGARRIVELQRFVVTMSKPVVTSRPGRGARRRHRSGGRQRRRNRRRGRHVALTEVKLGLAAAIISLTVHHRMSPRAAALTTLGGEVFSGTDAAAYDWSRRPCRLPIWTRRYAASATRSPPAPPRACASRRRSSTATWSHGSTPTARSWPPSSARLFASDEAREAMTAFLNRAR